MRDTQETTSRRPGKVYLVGAGPGDPKLITVRGLECLRKADVLVYDHLVSEKLLHEVRPECERIYVGKQAGRHTLNQEDINGLLVQKAEEGRAVVRLKGGDPFIFGRGGEEALILSENRIAFEVVPGVTAATAVPAYAGIPVTHRGLASVATLVTGHEDPRKDTSAIDWSKLSLAPGTLVCFMGVRNLSQIVEHLVRSGRSPDTPVALIQWGTTPSQRTVTGRLRDILQVADRAHLSPPALIVVGDVVALRDPLNWFETKPLFGRRILVTRTREQAGRLAAMLEDLGAEAIEFPTIEIRDPDDWAPLDQAIERLEGFNWLVFTSVNGVDKFFGRVFDLDGDIRSLKGLRIAAIGPATAARIEGYGLRVDLRPKENTAASLIERFKEVRDLWGAKILIPQADIGRELLTDELLRLGAEVTRVTAYRTVVPQLGDMDIPDLLKNGQIDGVTFTSSSTVRNFAKILDRYPLADLMKGVKVASIGPVTSETVRDIGLQVDIEPKEITIPALVEAMGAYFSRRPTTKDE